MANPGGAYPGRQIFVGQLESGNLAFAYFGSGRSAESKARIVSPYLPEEHALRILPVDPLAPRDSFRHYQAVRIDPTTGVLVVSNNQASMDPVFEAVQFYDFPRRHSVERRMRDILEGIGPEYDNAQNPTPRIMGAILPAAGTSFLGIVTPSGAQTQGFFGVPGWLEFIQTYDGKVDYSPFLLGGTTLRKNVFRSRALSALQLANELYEISDYHDATYGDLRVWCVAGERNNTGPGGWDIAVRGRQR